MRKQLLAMGSISALAIALSASAPANAIQLAPGLGAAPDAKVIHVQDRARGGERGPSMGNRGTDARINVSPRGNIDARGSFQSRGQVQTRELPRGQVQSRDFDRRDFSRDSDRRDYSRSDRRDYSRDSDRRDYSRDRRDDSRKDFSRWHGAKPHIVHRGWDRHHRHRFYGAFLIGVPYGYYAVTGNPCYDWIYGPEGWGYYWNYDRCPV
jgi:hypothetical protein